MAILQGAGSGESHNGDNSGESNAGNSAGKLLELHHSDYPGVILVTENNYAQWSRAMKLALGAKQKLQFVEGKIQKPHATDPSHDQWLKVDSMVTSWILNSISSDVAEGFMYAGGGAIEIWTELQQRFGIPDGTQIYQLQRELVSLTQGNNSLSTYFNKIKSLRDKLATVDDVPSCDCLGCTCGASKKLIAKENIAKIIQFVMGLNEEFDGIKDRVLVMEPIPTITKVFNMMMQVENKKNVQNVFVVDSEMVNQTACLAAPSGGRPGFKKRDNVDKRGLKCDHCFKEGHTTDTCFKLKGFPTFPICENWKGIC